MDEHPAFERDLLLITGIPGTGKTCNGNKFAREFDFLHHDLEDQQTQTLSRFNANPGQFIEELLNQKKDVVVTWGFGPYCKRSESLVRELRSAGFKWIWFDGNRPAALREFQKRATVQEIDFYRQMYRIEESRIVERLKPTVINSFDDRGQFKSTKELLAEIR
ncbi:MAG TPA: DNA/RNA helicase domain-containing protein, partial [Candidatus Sulfotelmatobacter sp.]